MVKEVRVVDRDTLVSVELGAGAHGVLEELQKKLGKTRSEIIRSAVLGYAACELWKIKVRDLPKVRKKAGFKLTREQRERLKEFHARLNKKADSKPYWPAVYSCMKVIMDGGYAFDDIMGALECAAEDDLVKAKMLQGFPIPLHSLLSEKMFARLIELSNNKVIDEACVGTVELVDVKNEAMSVLAESHASPSAKAKVYDTIQWAESKDEVQLIIHNFMAAENAIAAMTLKGESE